MLDDYIIFTQIDELDYEEELEDEYEEEFLFTKID